MKTTKRNITVQLDELTIKRARVVAAKRSTSLSRLVSQAIIKAAEEDDDYIKAKTLALDYLKKSFSLGGQTLPARELLHDR